MKRLILLVPLALIAACSKPASNDAPVDAPSSGAAPTATASASPAASAAPSSATSRYTSLKDCEVTDSNEGEDWSQSHCDGPDGWALQIDYGDARDDAQLLQQGKPAKPLNLFALTGGGFNALGDTVEWRGQTNSPPTALIMRNSVVEDPDKPDRPTALLLVVDLNQGCVVAQIRPQAGQNDKARAIADGPKQSCLKGNS